MGPPSYKEFTLMLPVQLHLSHFNLGTLIHLVVVLMFLSGLMPRLRDGTPLDASRMIVLLFLHTYIYTDEKVACFKLIG